MPLKYTVANATNPRAAGLVLLLLFVMYAAYGQTPAPATSKGFVYVLPAKSTALIERLLAGRTPSYVSCNRQTREVILFSFSFQPPAQVAPEYRTLLKEGNRVLKLNNKYYGVLLDYDLYFHPQKNHYLDGGEQFNALDVFVNIRGDYLKHTDWTKPKAKRS